MTFCVECGRYVERQADHAEWCTGHPACDEEWYCKGCGLPEPMFQVGQVDEDWTDDQTVRDMNRERKADGRHPFCSVGCAVQKLGVY